MAAPGNESEAIEFLLKEVDARISSFTRRQNKVSKPAKLFSMTQLVCSSLTIAIIALNVHFEIPGLTLLAIFLSLAAALAGQILHYYNYQERLGDIVFTLSRLKGLKHEIELFRIMRGDKKSLEEHGLPADVLGYHMRYQGILDDCNQLWKNQLGASAAVNKGAAKTSVGFKDIQP
jgi:hypothetical protein